MKRVISIISIVLITIVLIVLISLASATPFLMPSIKTAEVKTQFDFNIAYSYIGPGPANVSYLDENNVLMLPASLNPSSIVLNVTRIPGKQISSCDAIIEFYDIQIVTDSQVKERACYFIGTNYKQSLSDAELCTLFEHVKDITHPRCYPYVIGEFKFNMTDNESHYSTPIGSYGAYSTARSSLGLWTAGEPNAISISVQRIGYITVNDGAVSIYEDGPTSSKTMVQLSNYEDGFLYNNIIPATQLSQMDLFHPVKSEVPGT